MQVKLRPYQQESIDALFNYWGADGGNGLLVLPTGAGKSLVLAKICQELLQNWPSMRIGIVTHVKELVEQNAQEILRLWPSAPIGIYSAGVGRRDLRSKIMFMGIQSVHRKVQQLGKFDVLLVDEAHLIPKNSDTMYGRFIADCLEAVPDMRLVGLTATPYRLDSGRLDGKGGMFDAIVYEANVRDLIEQGYLSKLISKATLAQIDTKGLHKRGGEFIQSEMDARARIPTIIESAVGEICEHGEHREGWLIFCTGVEHAADVMAEVRKQGITCETVTGETPKGVRDRIIRDYKAKKIRCLTSVGVLTTGFNAPHVDLVALLRPTLSTGLYVQMVGRAFRLASGKLDALILDFAGNVTRHGPVDAVAPQRQGGAKGKKEKTDEEKEDTVRAKVCPACREYNAIGAKSCVVCGYEWPPEVAPHKPEAEETAILSTEAVKPQMIKVQSVRVRRHKKPGSLDTFRLTFETWNKSYSKWLCFEHGGRMGHEARMWWKGMGGNTPAPSTIAEALERFDAEIGECVGISVRKNGKYHDILSMEFEPGPWIGHPRVVQEKPDPFAGAGGWEHNADGPFGGAYKKRPDDYFSWGKKPADPTAGMTEDQKKVIPKIEALFAKTIENGCTPQEQHLAHVKANQLLGQYSLERLGTGQIVIYDEIPF
nr:DEAD/DEAH box helicase [Rhodoblastus acidophilus]